LRPGRSASRPEAERNQRERLFAATVATVARKGLEEVTVEDLTTLSGVSRSAFYKHFTDRQACFMAAMSELIEPMVEVATMEIELAEEESCKQAFERLLRSIAAQPAAAKSYFELHAAGPAGVALERRLLKGFEALGGGLLAAADDGQGMAPEIVAALIGGIQAVIHRRLYEEKEDELVELAPGMREWLFSYRPPPGPLGRAHHARQKKATFEERQRQSKPRERLLRSFAAILAEKGVRDTAVAEIVRRAKTSQRSFYDCFLDKEEAMGAALETGAAQMLAAALPALRSNPDWPEVVSETLEAAFSCGVREPEYAALGEMRTYARRTRTLGQREILAELAEGLVRPGYERAPEMPAIAAEAIGGALYSLFCEHVRAAGTKTATDMVPAAVYVTLAPFLGAEEAYRMAISGRKAVEERV